MIMSGGPIAALSQKDRDRAHRRHSMGRRLRSLAWSTLSLGVAATALGLIATRLVA